MQLITLMKSYFEKLYLEQKILPKFVLSQKQICNTPIKWKDEKNSSQFVQNSKEMFSDFSSIFKRYMPRKYKSVKKPCEWIDKKYHFVIPRTGTFCITLYGKNKIRKRSYGSKINIGQEKLKLKVMS